MEGAFMKRVFITCRAAAALTMLIAAIASGISSGALSQEVTYHFTEPYWQQRADYDIDVTLDTSKHMLTGTETITYRNLSPDTLREFHIHLYPNAYSEKDSPLLRDYLKGTLHFFVGLRESKRGWIDITGFIIDGAEAQFSVEGTILTSEFPNPVPPGGAAEIEIAFEEKIRPRLGRAGYIGEHYDIAQWYPKMVVYDRDGWHPDQFRVGEFYGEFGTFDVSITLPEGQVIAATGVPVSGDPGWDKNPPADGGGHRKGGHPHMGHGGGRGSEDRGGEGGAVKTVRFKAENVHDFAWSADPSYVVEDTLYNGYNIKVFYRAWNRHWADSVLARSLRSMKWLEDFAGPYPYPQISVADCPTHGAMEYPMLVMNGGFDEGLILHELGHSYFYASLANNERDEAWMDEGFTQYQMFRYMENRFGPYGKPRGGGWFASLYPEPKLWEGLSRSIIDRARAGFSERISTPVHKLENGHHTPAYVHAPLFLRAVRYMVGDEAFSEIVHIYCDRHKFKHVAEEDFLAICEEVSGMDLREMFKQWLHSLKSCDYRMDRFDVEKVESGYRADIKIDRKGELIMPLALAFRLENGNTALERIDGTLRNIEKSFNFESKPVSASINPDNEILDIYFADNFSPRRREFFSLDLPLNDYHPMDAYEFRWAPFGYYNDIDGGKAGLRLRTGYDDMYWKFTLQGAYGFESENADIYGAFEHPLGYFGRDSHIRLEGYHREGRQGASIVLDKIRRKGLYDPLAKFMSFYFHYQEMTDSSYVFPFTYDKGINLKAGLSLALYPKTDIFDSSIFLSYDRSFWGSDDSYEKFMLALRMKTARRVSLPIKPAFRLFLGSCAIDPPLQETFNLAGAGVLEKERMFWLRSVGGFPKDYYNNFHVPGDANLRGYFDADFGFKRIMSMNIETELPFPLPVGRRLSRMLDRKLYLFYDFGKVLDARPFEMVPPWIRPGLEGGTFSFDDILSDFGVGVSLWRITAEFPLYISHPVLNGDEENWDFRWTVGFNRLF